MKSNKQRIAVALLSLSLGGFGAWVKNEGESPVVQTPQGERLAPHIPTKGDVPTIGHGSTRYEDGTAVTLSDPPITRQRADELARNLLSKDELRFKDSIPGVKLYQDEYDLYLDFIGQYGIGNWRASSMRRELLQGEYAKACDALLKWRYAAGYDCSTTVNGAPNKRCWGVWQRQLERHEKCRSAQ